MCTLGTLRTIMIALADRNERAEQRARCDKLMHRPLSMVAEALSGLVLSAHISYPVIGRADDLDSRRIRMIFAQCPFLCG